MKIYQYDLGHMTMMGVMYIYGKNLFLEIYFPGASGRILTKVSMLS